MKNFPEIHIKIIPHKEQRYDTAGDYFLDENKIWQFRISKMNSFYVFLVLIHELIEWFLTQINGIREEDITKFDIESGLEDPGASKKAPYHKEHMFATKIEYLILKELKLNKDKYNKSFDKLKWIK